MEKSLNFIKEYLSIIILIPTVLGSLYQIFNLIYFVGLPYIRYFSISQLIPDGILIIFLIIFLSIVYILVAFFNLQYDELKNDYGDDGFHRVSVSLTFGFLILILPFSIYGLSHDYYDDEIANLYNHTFCQVVVTINLFLLFLYTNEIINSNFKKNNNHTLPVFKIIRVIIYSLAIISSIYHIYNFKNTIIKSNELIVQSKNLYNFKKLKEKLKKDTSILEVKILYLNRDYIFCEIITSLGKEIAIIEQKELLSIFPKKSDDES